MEICEICNRAIFPHEDMEETDDGPVHVECLEEEGLEDDEEMVHE